MEKSFGERVAEARFAVSSLSPEEAYALKQRAAVQFVDPRPSEAISSTTGLIPGALEVSLNAIASGQLPPALSDASTPIITACQAGPMGAIAAHELVKRGFTNVRYVEGGTQGWLDAGFETV